MNNKIIIKGAREHNLKNIDIELERNQLIVMTGLSGSGKSSLAFDTIYADGQRRYVESLSSYARMFLGQANKPDVDSIEGLSPAISIDHIKEPAFNSRYHYRNTRLLPSALRENRYSALSGLRKGNKAADHRPDNRQAHGT